MSSPEAMSSFCERGCLPRVTDYIMMCPPDAPGVPEGTLNFIQRNLTQSKKTSGDQALATSCHLSFQAVSVQVDMKASRLALIWL